MDGELVRFFHPISIIVPVEIALYDMDGALRAMRGGEILWITDLVSNSGILYDWLYDDPEDTGRTDANTICATRSLIRRLQTIGFNYPCPVRRLMRLSSVSDDEVYWFGHGLIRSA